MGRFDEDEKVRSQDISNGFIVMILIFAVAFFAGLFWGISIGGDMEQQKAFGESILQGNLQVTLSDTLGISDKITVNVITGT